MPTFVSEDLFAAVPRQLTETRQRCRESRRGAKYLLQRLLEGTCCGYGLYGKPVSRSGKEGKVPYAYYRRSGTNAYRFGGKRICQNKQVRMDKLEEACGRMLANCSVIQSCCAKSMSGVSQDRRIQHHKRHSENSLPRCNAA